MIARVLMLETLRSSTMPIAGVEAAPAGPGPAAGLLLDLFVLAPTLFVFAQVAFDSSYRLKKSLGLVLLVLLGVWAVFSTTWAADRFIALVSSVHLLSAVVTAWTAFQLARSWSSLRWCAGVAAGLLLILTLVGYDYRLNEWPEVKRAWHEQRTQILAEHHWSAGSFDERQFDKRINNGEIMGFSLSPNTYAALLVLLGLISAGVAIQRGMDRAGWGMVVATSGLIVLAVPDLKWAGSRGAGATAVLGAVLLVLLGRYRATLARHARLTYWAGLAGAVVAAALLVGHGLYHGTLFHDSLTFRWRYWVGSAKLIASHPLRGVGWENFGPAYLAFRLPIASEEIRDPHNFIVRVFAELGAVGGILLLVGLARTTWEMVRPLPEPIGFATPLRQAPSRPLLLPIVGMVSFAMLPNFLVAVDLSAGGGYLFYEVVRRVVFGVALVLGIGLACVRFSKASDTDGDFQADWEAGSATWMRLALLVALGMFLVHNLIDFAIFEYGPMFLFALLVGVSGAGREAGAAEAGRHRRLKVAMLIGAAVGWIGMAVLVVVPVVRAELWAWASDNAMRRSRLDEAAADLESALAIVGYNGDYAYRGAMIRLQEGQLDRAANLMDRAIAASPNSIGYMTTRAHLRAESKRSDPAGAVSDFERALRLDPANVPLYLDFARMLIRLGHPEQAKQVLDAGWQKNLQIDPADPKRLSRASFDGVWK